MVITTLVRVANSITVDYLILLQVCLIPDCHDLFPKCAEWSQKDECKKNLAWMEENCPKSCEVCSRTPDELREICGARLTTGEIIN